MSTGNQVGAAAQGASAQPSIEALLSQLGDTHRRMLTQAQLLGKVAGDWLASAVPGSCSLSSPVVGLIQEGR